MTRVCYITIYFVQKFKPLFYGLFHNKLLCESLIQKLVNGV